jgi:hypothetical protein
MASILPCRTVVSDRFPVASFVVHVPPERIFEIACATDPTLFLPTHRHRRTRGNFFTTRSGGFLRAPAGQATYMVPQEQLARFAGAQRLYYALGTYAGVRGEDAMISLEPNALEQTPSISLSPDFTGRSVDRRRFGARTAANDDRYGGAGESAAALLWGGDAAAPADDVISPATKGAPSDGAAALDDGYGDATSLEDSEPMGLEEPDGSSAIQLEAADAEPPGYEDAPDLRRHTAAGQDYDDGRGYDGATSLSSFAAQADDAPRAEPSLEALDADDDRLGSEHPLAYAPAEARYGRGADVEIIVEAEEEPAEELSYAAEDVAPPAPTPAAPRASAIPLTIPEKFRIVRVVAMGVSGDASYGALRSDPVRGVVAGMLAFSQRSGMLGRVLRATERRDAEAFRRTFGDDARELLEVTNARTHDERMQPVGGRPLSSPEWQRRFTQAAALPAYHAAQNEVAIEGLVDRNLGFAHTLGFNTDRALAVLVDRCVDAGNGGGRSFVVRALGIFRHRRGVDDALAFLGFGSLADFQRSIGHTSHHGWDATTYAALVGALRAAGPGAPVQVPPLATLLDRIAEAASTEPFAERVRSLRASRSLNDTVYQLEPRAAR